MKREIILRVAVIVKRISLYIEQLIMIQLTTVFLRIFIIKKIINKAVNKLEIIYCQLNSDIIGFLILAKRTVSKVLKTTLLLLH